MTGIILAALELLHSREGIRRLRVLKVGPAINEVDAVGITCRAAILCENSAGHDCQGEESQRRHGSFEESKNEYEGDLPTRE